MPNVMNMKKSLFLVASLAALMAGGISVAQAAATSARLDGCGVFDANLNVVAPLNAKITATQSENGNAMLQCKADNVPTSGSGGAVRFDYASTGASCGVLDSNGQIQMTQDWEETLSASGHATMTCHYKTPTQ